MIEPFSKSILIGMAVTGQTITKNTSVSIALVLAIMAATVWVTQAFTSTESRLSGLEDDMQEIKAQQTIIIGSLNEG